MLDITLDPELVSVLVYTITSRHARKHGYPCSRAVSPDFDQYQIKLLGDRAHVCEQLVQSRYESEIAASWIRDHLIANQTHKLETRQDNTKIFANDNKWK